MGYLVACYDTTLFEYQVFGDEIEAKTFAHLQEEEADQAQKEELRENPTLDPDDLEYPHFPVYPLYAGPPLDD